jgi:hypothetical protein
MRRYARLERRKTDHNQQSRVHFLGIALSKFIVQTPSLKRDYFYSKEKLG